MRKFQWFLTPSKTLNAVAWILIVSLSFLAGCVESTTQLTETSSTDVPKGSPISQENLYLTFTPEAGMQESTPHVSPYIDVVVVDVKIHTLETNPVQVELVIQGTLPDQCKYEYYSVENRRDQNIKITLKGIHPADTSCSQTPQTIEYVLLLGRDLPESERGFAPGDYELTVNKYQTTFSIQE